ncbi:MAG: hypothetical protein ABIK73_03135 [candidate division WOR-3 bacterium]
MVVDLEQFLKDLNKIASKLKAYEKFIEHSRLEDSYERSRMLSELEGLIKNQSIRNILNGSSLLITFDNFLAQEREKIAQEQEEFHFNLSLKLAERLSGFGELKGQLPILRIKYYTLKFNFNAGTVSLWWGPEKELIKNLPLNLDLISETIKKFDSGLQSRWRSYVEFYELLKNAYNRYLIFNNLSWGEKVNLLEILRELVMLSQSKAFWINPIKNNFREYSRISFSYDLYRLKIIPEFAQKFQLAVATFALTENKGRSIWIPDNDLGGGTHYSTIAFQQ